jgi:hypothetical protein
MKSMAGIKLATLNSDGKITLDLDEQHILTETSPGQIIILRRDGNIVKDINRAQLCYIAECYVINRSFLAGEMIFIEDMDKVKIEKSSDEKIMRITLFEKKEEEMIEVRTPKEDKKVGSTYNSINKPKSLIKRLQEKIFGQPIQK